MVTVVLCIALVFVSIKWFLQYINTLVLSNYIVKKGYKSPSDKEIEECTKFVLKNLLKRKK